MTQPEDAAAARYRAPALDKGLDILEVLAAQSEGLTRTDLVRVLGRGPSEIYRMLERLVARGYVARTRDGDRYVLTMKLFQLAHRHPPLRRLIARAQPLMDAFARESGQSCHLVVPERGACVVVAHAAPEAIWEFHVRIGAELDFFTTSSGLTLLAFQKPEHRAETMAQWGLTDAEQRLRAIEPHLAEIRSQGHREGASQQLAGVIDISVPILDADRDAVAVLTCAYIEYPGNKSAPDRSTVGRQLSRYATLLSLADR
jgi:DNA-binding IclR family transcriptional regulator